MHPGHTHTHTLPSPLSGCCVIFLSLLLYHLSDYLSRHQHREMCIFLSKNLSPDRWEKSEKYLKISHSYFLDNRHSTTERKRGRDENEWKRSRNTNRPKKVRKRSRRRDRMCLFFMQACTLEKEEKRNKLRRREGEKDHRHYRCNKNIDEDDVPLCCLSLTVVSSNQSIHTSMLASFLALSHLFSSFAWLAKPQQTRPPPPSYRRYENEESREKERKRKKTRKKKERRNRSRKTQWSEPGMIE